MPKKKAAKKRAPQDLTRYSLRGLQRRVAELEKRVALLEFRPARTAVSASGAH